MEMLKLLNLGIVFLLELCMYASLGYWGFQGKKSFLVKCLLGIGLPLFAAILWGIFAAPSSQHRLKLPLRLIFKLVLFSVAAFALYKTGHTILAMLFGAVAVVSEVLVLVWKQ